MITIEHGAPARTSNDPDSANWTATEVNNLFNRLKHEEEEPKIYPRLICDDDVLAIILANVSDASEMAQVMNFLHDVQYSLSPFSSASQDSAKDLNKNLNKPSAIHFEQAKKIRDYYANKIMFRILNNEEITSFRKALYQFVTTQINTVDEQYQKILVKIFEFYAYDMKLEHLHETYDVSPFSSENTNKVPDFSKVNLKLVETMNRTTQKVKHHEYWFVNSVNRLHRIIIAHNSELKHLFDRYLDDQKYQVAIEGYIQPTEFRGVPDFNFYSINKWKLIF